MKKTELEKLIDKIDKLYKDNKKNTYEKRLKEVNKLGKTKEEMNFCKKYFIMCENNLVRQDKKMRNRYGRTKNDYPN